MPSRPTRVRELLTRYLLPHRGLVSSLTVFLFASIGLQLINPQILEPSSIQHGPRLISLK